MIQAAAIQVMEPARITASLLGAKAECMVAKAFATVAGVLAIRNADRHKEFALNAISLQKVPQ